MASKDSECEYLENSQQLCVIRDRSVTFVLIALAEHWQVSDQGLFLLQNEHRLVER